MYFIIRSVAIKRATLNSDVNRIKVYKIKIQRRKKINSMAITD